jgi:phosphoribosylformylglycinamidine (FGAM) synthase-like enzyme
LAVTLAEKCFANGIGATIDLSGGKLSRILALFGEMPSRVLVSCNLPHFGRIQEVAKQREILVVPLGTTIDDNLKISIDGVPVVSVAVAELKQAWTSALESALHAGSE